MNAALLETRVERVLSRYALLDARLVLALSGGIDSMVLLEVLAALARRHPLRLSALHVNHGISPRSAQWAQFCVERCAQYGLRCEVVHVRVERAPGESLEARARAMRYAAYQLQSCDALILGHQLDDQVETLLLQLLRGAGVQGLAGMPAMRLLPGDERSGGVLLVRPLLDVARSAIVEFALECALSWVEDDSNAQSHFDRNYLRHEVLPQIARRFPGYRQTLARVRQNLADASELLDEVACADAAHAVNDEGLSVDALRVLSPARARNLLRWFIVRQGVRLPARKHLEAGMAQLLEAGEDREPRLQLEGGTLRRFAGRLHFVADLTPIPADWRSVWRGEPALVLPHHLGEIRFDADDGRGLSRAALKDGSVSVRVRRGGERLRLSAAQPERALKDVLREARIPPWQRARLPLLFCDEALCWVPGIGGDFRWAARGGEPGVVPRWIPHGGDEPAE